MQDVSEPKIIDTWMFRVNGEVGILVITIGIVLFIGYILFNLNLWIFGGLFLLGLFYIYVREAQLLGGAVRVLERQFGEIYRPLVKYAKRLDTPRVRVYVIQDPNPNAFTFGFRNATIVLTSSLVENFTQDEINFVIAHELGHVKAKHNIILSLISPLGSRIPVATWIFSFWQRKAEYSADRCALILTKDIESAVYALLKLSVGLKLSKRIDLKTLRRQIVAAQHHSVRVGELFIDHPLVANRITNLVRFKKESFKTNN